MKNNMYREIKKVSRLMGNYKWIFIGAYLVYFLAQSFAIYVLGATSYQYLLDGAIGGDWQLFKKGLLYVGFFCIVICLILPILYEIISILKVKVNISLQDKVYEHLLRLPINFFETHTSSGIIGIILNNLSGVNLVMDGFFSTVMECLVLSPIAIYFLIIKHFVIGVFISIIFAILTGVISLKFVDYVRRQGDMAQTKLGGTNHVISDLFKGICCEKIYNTSDIIYKSFHKNNYMYLNATKNMKLKNNISTYSVNFMGGVNYLTILIIGVLLMIKGEKTIGEIMGILSITTSLYYVLTKFFTLMQNSQVHLACCDKIIDFLNQNEEIDVNNQLEKESCDSLIQFKDVTFQYRKGNNILKDLTFDIKQGEKVNLVGYSGNGKSTVVKLILGFYKTYNGSITIDGFEIKDTSDEIIKGYVSYVSQENLLFNCSVKENLRYGNFSLNEEDIIEVAKKVGIHETIMSLPQKYDTVITSNGVNFSKEDCSKIAIARAMLKKASIVVLDEAMAKINPKNEMEIKVILDKLTEGKTVINIAHKLDSIAQNERIIIFEKGKIVEDGIKRELLAKNSILKKYII